MNSDKKRIAELETKIIQLEAIIEELRNKIDDILHRKNSRNSSIPPSKDENRPSKNINLREKNGKKVGGQPGHEGSTLEMVAKPNFVIEHSPEFCSHCGEDLSGKPATLLLRRQVVDIPSIVPEFTEHRIFQKTCTCGQHNKASFPKGVNASISYGANIQATIAYMHTREYLPFERMSEFFRDICNIKISQGTICSLLKSFAQKAQPAYELIGEKVEAEKVVGGDETGAKVNGKKGWFWTFQSSVVTYIIFSNNRGVATIDMNFPNGFKYSTIVHDCWKCYFQTKCKTHQICIAHLLRELLFFEERYQSKWAKNLRELLQEAIKLKRGLTPIHYLNPIEQRDKIIDRFSLLLQSSVSQNRKDLYSFYKRMHKYQNYVFNFLFYHEVPPDNNSSERAIRNVKVKQKVSGQFKTERGAQIYAVIRSITDTCIKNNQNVLAVFKTIAMLQPE